MSAFIIHTVKSNEAKMESAQAGGGICFAITTIGLLLNTELSPFVESYFVSLLLIVLIGGI